MRKAVKNKLMSIWGHTEMELLSLTKTELLSVLAKISNIINDAIDLIDEDQCTHCGNVNICGVCLDEMCSDTAQ